MQLDPLLYDVQFDSDTGEMNFYDKSGGLIYSCVLERENPQPLTLEALEGGSTVALKAAGTAEYPVYQTSLDGGTTWEDYSVTDATPITLNVGEKVCFRIKTPRVNNQSDSDYVKFVMTGRISASGNCNSMITPDFKDLKDLTQVTDESGTVVGADYGFMYLFQGCTSLIQAPELPATTLADHCYHAMFISCTNLTQAPELPATTLAFSCYAYMFNRCRSLTQAPALPATALAGRCYTYMFFDCTNLTQAPALPATTLAEHCYSHMFSDCTSLTQAPELPATELANYCYSYMFNGCTGLTQAPALSARTLASSCYAYMFLGCSKLVKVVCYATDMSASSCTYYWLLGASSTGDFYADPSTEWKSGTSGIPSGWTRHDIAELEA